jgi:hypothetical protein
VVGDYERALAGRQATQIIGSLNSQHVTLWLPEAGGPVHVADQPTKR